MTKSSKSFLILLAAAALAVLGALTLLTGAARASGGVQAHVVSFDWSPTSGTLLPGESADVTVQFDQPVLVTGDPVIFLGVDSNMFADLSHYESGSGTNTLTFRWTPKPGLHGLVSIRGIIDGLWDGNATLTDTEGNPAEMHLAWSGDAYTPTDLWVDTAPVITSADVPADGHYAPGDTLSFAMHLSEQVVVDTTNGIPSLVLDIGGRVENVAYTGGSGTDTLVFTYTVRPGNTDWDGPNVLGFDGGGSSIQDVDGNDAVITMSAFPNSLAGVLVHAATWVSSVDVPANGTYRAGDNLDVRVHFTSPVTISGPPRVNLFFNGGFRKAVYHAGSGTSDITFRYTVQPGDLDADGIGLGAVVFMNAGTEGGWISDGINVPDLNLRNVPATNGVLVDTARPTVSSIDVPAPGFYHVGDELDLVMHFDEDLVIDLSGSIPVVFINLGGQPQEASYVSGSGSELTFRYTVQAGDFSDDGLRITGWLMRGARFWDAAGNEIDGTLNNIGDDSHVFVDTEAPRVIGVVVPLDGNYKAGDQLDFTVSYIEPVVVSGTPALGLTVGTHARSASYRSGSGTDTLHFRYTVQAADLDTDGVEVGVIAGGTITDPAGHSVQPGVGWWVPWTGGVTVGTAAPTPTPTPTPTPSDPTPAPAPEAKDTVPPTKPAGPTAKVKGGQVQVSFSGSTDNVKVVGYRLYRDGTAIATVDGTGFKLPLGMISKPGKLVLQLRALDGAGNLSDPVVITLTRSAHPKAPKVKPAWAWKVARWQDTAKATRGVRPHPPATLPKWYAKWNAWHKAPVKATVG